jgi:hypothetical protein
VRTLGGFCIVLFATGGLFAQVRGAYTNPRPLTNPFGSVVFPASPSSPTVQRTFGSVVFPGSGTPQFRTANPFVQANPVQVGRSFPNPGRPGVIGRGIGPGGINNGGRQNRRQQTTFVYAYPVYVGGYGNGYYDASMQPEMAPLPPPAQPNVTVVMPPQAPPVVVREGQHPMMESQQGPVSAYQPPLQEETPPEPMRYLIAFKDHTIYSAVAYWVDGDTLHYFTSGNTHNQVSLSLVDRDLSQRLNKESGVELKLPAPKQ